MVMFINLIKIYKMSTEKRVRIKQIQKTIFDSIRIEMTLKITN